MTSMSEDAVAVAVVVVVGVVDGVVDGVATSPTDAACAPVGAFFGVAPQAASISKHVTQCALILL
jgi:hypothetical protein